MSKLAGVYGGVAGAFDDRFYGLGSEVRPYSIAEVYSNQSGLGIKRSTTHCPKV
jgi:hypothetical protein